MGCANIAVKMSVVILFNQTVFNITFVFNSNGSLSLKTIQKQYSNTGWFAINLKILILQKEKKNPKSR